MTEKELEARIATLEAQVAMLAAQVAQQQSLYPPAIGKRVEHLGIALAAIN